MAFIAVKLSDMSNLEVKVRPHIFQAMVEDQNLSFFKHNPQKILIPAFALNHLQHPSLLHCFSLLVLQLHPGFEYLRRLDVVKPLLLVLAEAVRHDSPRGVDIKVMELSLEDLGLLGDLAVGLVEIDLLEMESRQDCHVAVSIQDEQLLIGVEEADVEDGRLTYFGLVLY